MSQASVRRPVVAVILAGGSGSRSGLDHPKQFVRLDGVTILGRAVRAFEACAAVDSIVVVAPPAHLAQTRQVLAEHDLGKLEAVIGGGGERHDSSRAALDHLGDRDADVLIHDAARPFVSGELIAACIDALAVAEAVEPVVASVDTLVRVVDGVVAEVVPRQQIGRVQTPQGFRLRMLRDAFDRAAGDPSVALTDDVGVVLRHRPDVEVVAVPGEEGNVKITTAHDLDLAVWLAARG